MSPSDAVSSTPFSVGSADKTNVWNGGNVSEFTLRVPFQPEK